MTKNNLVIIKLVGGLGNQMFQYAVASIVAKLNKSQILVEKSFFDQKKSSGHTTRDFELGIFNNFLTEASASEVRFFSKLSTVNKIRRELGLNYPKIFNETSFSFNHEVFSTKSPVYLKGYYQSHKYFIDYENYIRGLFFFPLNKLDDKNREVLLSIKSRNSISVHIRRGDYVEDKIAQQFHGNCNREYYEKAISLVTGDDTKFCLFFFSDDIQWVKEQFQNLSLPKVFIDHNSGDNHWKDMFLMSSCDHNIIANSSFSWWAAWLNLNPNKIVIAPKRWFADNALDTSDLTPPTWIRL